MSDNNNYTEAVARHLRSKLHQGARGQNRCRCGACRHQILLCSRRSGLTLGRLIAALPAEPAREPEPEFTLRPFTAPVVETVTIARGQCRQTGGAAILSDLVGVD